MPIFIVVFVQAGECGRARLGFVLGPEVREHELSGIGDHRSRPRGRARGTQLVSIGGMSAIALLLRFDPRQEGRDRRVGILCRDLGILAKSGCSLAVGDRTFGVGRLE